MNIIWQDKDITGYVMVKSAVARDTCGGRCDGLDIEFENAESWYRWGPEEDDVIRVTQDGWDSGNLYLNTIAPANGKYRVLATALPCRARQKAWDSYENKTLEEIIRKCAAQTEMDFRVYGIDNSIQIPYIQRENEGCAAFLHRIGKLEGAKLKCVNGRYAMIGIEWAQDRQPVATVSIAPDQDGTDYRRSGSRDAGLSIITPYATGKAKDSGAGESGLQTEITELPAMSDIQAARWARNLLMEKNRRSETLKIYSTFNPAWTAMTRINITGGTDADGEWLIEEVEHNLKDGRSTATMHRCIRTIQ